MTSNTAIAPCSIRGSLPSESIFNTSITYAFLLSAYICIESVVNARFSRKQACFSARLDRTLRDQFGYQAFYCHHLRFQRGFTIDLTAFPERIATINDADFASKIGHSPVKQIQLRRIKNAALDTFNHFFGLEVQVYPYKHCVFWVVHKEWRVVRWHRENGLAIVTNTTCVMFLPPTFCSCNDRCSYAKCRA